MADLRARFATLDAVPAPDLWSEVERRAAAGATSDAMGAPQRLGAATPTWRGARPAEGRATGRRLVLVLVLLGLLVGGGLVIGIGSGLIRLPSVSTPAPSEPPPPIAGFALQPVQIEDFSAVVSIPDTWQAVAAECCPDYREFTGSEPEGHLSVSHESPYAVTICDPECQPVDIPPSIPYSAPKQLDALKAGVAAVAGNSEWTDLPLEAARGRGAADTTDVAADGPNGIVYIVGSGTATWSPSPRASPSTHSTRLLDAILADLECRRRPSTATAICSMGRRARPRSPCHCPACGWAWSSPPWTGPLKACVATPTTGR
jgi:hypothetical protein